MPRRVRYNAATTLDGYIASPDGSASWIVEDERIDFAALYAEFDVFVMGRKTYHVMRSFAAQSSDDPLAGKRVFVVSRTLEKPQDGDNSDITIVGDDFLDVIRRLREEEDGKDVWLMGGGELVAACLEAGLVDSIEAAVMPVVLGDGIKMIASLSPGESNRSWRLRLRGVDQLDSGILMTRYDVLKH
ncbi:dihydrofolate reductase [Sodiomyces alkalinus F11]|uniref:2,5-diamino-6-ribosylamino-4(3H)-pyrimidinone 5'-phosphate reductase n=1 Tax=Sodiomyces alkalinus (strain CBS 110278 / VKM F-3762 / F11) TaxID=1314773 RepID=A0A3N2PUR9_SODAK|nr:dihydrofolate reductase [Sodiomyces alkalinus F11]ROT38214.1 dihydrofolate reductase [Sodiomyces alkalinus F11]